MKIKHPLRLAAVSIFILFFSAVIVFQILKIQRSNQYSEIKELETIIIPANRGNIYTCNNKLLAVTSSEYDIRIDGPYAFGGINPRASTEDLDQLASDLSKIFKNKTKRDYVNDLRKAKNNRYYLLKRSTSPIEIEKLKTIDFYKKSLHGGLIIKEYVSRKKPNSNSAARTIGDLYKNNTPKYGLEYSYNAELMGRDGKHLVIREPGNDFRKINNSNNIHPEDGKDLITTLDLDLQDILEQALLRQLETYEANFGTAILMEVRTGQIKAIANLKKTKTHTYAESLNFAVTQQVEPGSTFKLASLMAYFEDYNGSIDDTIDCKNGHYQFKGAPIVTKDTKPLGNVSIKEVFAKSSNIGIARLITKYYNKTPERFIDRLYNFSLGEKSNIDLIGVPIPQIISPSDKSWSGITLPWMAFGYGVNLTPLDILTFYNTVANNGYVAHPYLGNYLRQGSKLVETPKHTISHTICSEETIKKLKILLREVVKNGTGKKLNSLPFSVSGKTGTSVYKNQTDNKNYQASFVGFFPSENPQFSCIVLIDSPNKNLGFHGSEVAIPAFKTIAEKIYVQEGTNWAHNIKSDIRKNLNNPSSLTKEIEKLTFNIDTLNINDIQYYPRVVGMHIRDALYVLESIGCKVIVEGDFGKVKQQYPKPDSPIKKDLAITLII